MGKEEEQPKGRVNILGQLLVHWKDRKGKQKGIVLDKEDMDRLFEDETRNKKKGGNRENPNRTNLE